MEPPISTPNPKSILSLFFFTISIVSTTTSAYSIASPSLLVYSKHCNQIIPESTTLSTYVFPFRFLQLHNAYVLNAQQILGSQSPNISATFSPSKVDKTLTPNVLKIDAVLHLTVPRNLDYYSGFRNRGLYTVRGGPKFRRTVTNALFTLSGYWSSSSGQLCMVGSGGKSSNIGNSFDYNVVFKLNYPNSSTIFDSLVHGTLESLDLEGSKNYFTPITMMGFSLVNYEYSVVKEEIEHECGNGNGSLSEDTVTYPWQHDRCAGLVRLAENFELVYGSSCDENGCKNANGVLGKYMSMNVIECLDEGMIRVLFDFSNASNLHTGFYRFSDRVFDPRRTLVAEGAWSGNRSKICFVACKILGFNDSPMNASIGDCSFRLNFTFPAVLSIRSQSVVNGQVWSIKTENETGYFDRVGIRTSGFVQRVLPDMRYEFTEIERASYYCGMKNVSLKQKGWRYPDAYSSDMRIHLEVRNNKGKRSWGRAIPISVGGQFVQDFTNPQLVPVKRVPKVTKTKAGLLNMSYQISFKLVPGFELGRRNFTKRVVTMSAEGTYDTTTGHLCMIGCLNRNAVANSSLNASEAMDCGIFVNFQFPALKSHSGDSVTGSIESTHEASNPLYFERLDLSAISILKGQAAESIWRVDLELTVVLISNTLLCIFIVLQLFHVKNHPDSLPFISIVMLAILTLGHMIPLLLNFDAFLSNRSRQPVLLASDGWLEVNEVLVRVIMMIAFLLECRLLQLTWSARGSGESHKSLWAAEKKVASLCLPLCIVGLLIVALIHPRTTANQFITARINHSSPHNQGFSLWSGLKSYAGFILDAFLLPQIVFNILSDAKEKALCNSYYIGTTVVRLMPHAYDLFRAHSSSLKLDLWYIYANPRLNYYSTAWDIIVSCCGLLFVVVIYLQQRLGGRCILPWRFRELLSYEKVPVVRASGSD